MKKLYAVRVAIMAIGLSLFDGPVVAQAPALSGQFPVARVGVRPPVRFGFQPVGKSIYSDFTQNALFSMKTGEKTSILLTTGFSYEAFKESWAIWIDIDHDGSLPIPTDELAFTAVQGAPADGTPSFSTAGFIKLPTSALPGLTRVRVAMRRGNGGAGSPCDVLDYGEIEDYMVNVAPRRPVARLRSIWSKTGASTPSRIPTGSVLRSSIRQQLDHGIQQDQIFGKGRRSVLPRPQLFDFPPANGC